MELQEDDKKEFLRALLGKRVFTKKYNLFQNNVSLTLRSLTVQEANALLLLEEQNADQLLDGTLLSQIRILFHLESLIINSTPKQVVTPDKVTLQQRTFADICKDCSSVFSGMDDILFQTLLRTHNSFIDTVLALRAGGLDPNF